MAIKDSVLKVVIKVQDLSKAAVDGFKQGWRDAAEEADKASASVRKTAKETDRASASVKKIANEVDKYGNELTEAHKAQGRFIDKTGRMREANGRFVKGLEKSSKTLNQNKTALLGAGTGIGAFAAKLGALAGAYVGLNTLKNSLIGILQTGDYFKGLELRINAAMGSIAQGKQATAWIKEFTKNTPLQLDQTTEAFLQLKNYGIDPMDGSLQSIVDQNANLGGSYEKLQGIVVAFGQAWSKGKLQQEEMNQLRERGVPILDLLTKATGKNAAELEEMQRKGQLTHRVMADVFRVMGQQNAGAAAKNMNRLTGLISNLRDIWVNWLDSISKKGLYEYAQNQLKTLLTRIEDLIKKGKLDEWAKAASDGLISIGEALKATVSFVVGYKNELILAGKVMVGLKLAQFAQGFGTVAGAVSGATKQVKAYTLALSGIALAGFSGFQIGDYLYKEFESVRKYGVLLVGAIKAIVVPIRLAWAVLKAPFKDETISDLVKKEVKAISSEFGTLSQQFKDIGTDVEHSSNQISSATDKVAESTRKVPSEAERARQALEDMAKATESSTKAMREFGVDVGTALGGIDDASKQAIDSFKSIAEEILESSYTAEEKAALIAAVYKKSFSEVETESGKLALKSAFNELEINAVSANASLQGVFDSARDSVQGLGKDIDRMGSNYTKAGREALRAFDRVIARQGETKESAKATSQDIVDAYVSAYAELQTAAEKADLNAGLRKALKEQRISLAEYNKAISEASNATKEFVDIQKEATAVLIGANEELENTGENTEEAAARGSGAAASLAEVIAGLSERMGGLSDAAKQAFDQAVFGKLKTIGTDAGETGNRIKERSQSIKDLDEDIINSFDATGLVDYQLELKRTADEIERSFLEQQDAVNRVNQKYEAGQLSLEQYIRLLKQARGAADLLDQAELDNITQSIEAAREQMESFRKTTEDSVRSLEQELLSLNGSKLEQENFDFRLRELDLQENWPRLAVMVMLKRSQTLKRLSRSPARFTN